MDVDRLRKIMIRNVLTSNSFQKDRVMKKNLLFISFLLFFLFGCNFVTTLPSIFENPECTAPCWRGITPGETTLSEAISILNDIPDVIMYSTNIDRDGTIFDEYFIFGIGDPSGYGTAGYLMIIDDVVEEIKFHNRLFVTVGEMISVVGEPESILVIDDHNEIFINLINVETGVLIGYDTMGRPFSVGSRVRENISVERVYYFNPDIADLLIESGEFTLGLMEPEEYYSNLYPWLGYGTFHELYPTEFPD